VCKGETTREVEIRMPKCLYVIFSENGFNGLSKVQVTFTRITGSQINFAGNKSVGIILCKQQWYCQGKNFGVP
jgi:hypothetical protein